MDTYYTMHKLSTNCWRSNISKLNTNTLSWTYISNNVKIKYKLAGIEHPWTKYQHERLYQLMHKLNTNCQGLNMPGFSTNTRSTYIFKHT